MATPLRLPSYSGGKSAQIRTLPRDSAFRNVSTDMKSAKLTTTRCGNSSAV